MKWYVFLAVALITLSACGGKVNEPLTGSPFGVIPNGNIEQIADHGMAAEWSFPWWLSRDNFYRDTLTVHSGKGALCIAFSDEAKSGQWEVKVNLRPWSKYRFTGWIKAENLEGEAGFNMNGLDVRTPLINASCEWTKVEKEFETGADDCVALACCLGARRPAKGEVWFDDMSFELISSESYETSLSISPEVAGPEMSEYIYGQFIEHLGRCIYGGIWAEMVRDRKFWYEPNTKESPWEIQTDNKPSSAFRMDRKDPYVGTQSVVLKANNLRNRIGQKGFHFRKEVNINGYIIMKADRPTDVLVSFHSPGKKVRQQMEIKVGTEYRKYPVFVNVTKGADDVVMWIAPAQTGELWIGAVSLMPADNVDGFRADVLEKLRGLDAPVYRWPGGNFVSGYDWRDGIGDRDRRPPRKNPAWTGVEYNDVGLHEFYRLCELINCEPYVAVNAGLGGWQEAAAEVEYCNGNATTKEGARRAKNGHAAPFNVKWWSVGNEMFGDWQLGFMSTEDFVKKHNQFANAMRKVDPSIKLIAVGEVGDWDEMIMSRCSNNMDLVSEHFYKQDWHGGGLYTHVMQIPQEIKRRVDAHRYYRETIPGLAEKDIRICMDEWNYWYGPHIYGELGTRYFLRDALGIAAGLNEYLRQSDMVFMANYAQTVNVIGAIKTNDTTSCYATTGYALKMYHDEFGTIPVKIEGDTRPLDVAAAYNRRNSCLTISAVNATWDEVELPIAIGSDTFTYNNKVYSWAEHAVLHTLTGPDDMAYNAPGQPDKVFPTSKELKSWKKVILPPFSANIISIPITEY